MITVLSGKTEDIRKMLNIFMASDVLEKIIVVDATDYNLFRQLAKYNKPGYTLVIPNADDDMDLDKIIRETQQYESNILIATTYDFSTEKRALSYLKNAYSFKLITINSYEK